MDLFSSIKNIYISTCNFLIQFQPLDPDLFELQRTLRQRQCRLTLFLVTLFYCALQRLHFLQVEGVWQPCLEQVCWSHFPSSIGSLSVSVLHFGNSPNIPHFEIIIVFVMVDQ